MWLARLHLPPPVGATKHGNVKTVDTILSRDEINPGFTSVLIRRWMGAGGKFLTFFSINYFTSLREQDETYINSSRCIRWWDSNLHIYPHASCPPTTNSDLHRQCHNPVNHVLGEYLGSCWENCHQMLTQSVLNWIKNRFKIWVVFLLKAMSQEC